MAIYALGDREPNIDPTAYLHPDCVIIGGVAASQGTQSLLIVIATAALGAFLRVALHVDHFAGVLGRGANVDQGRRASGD